MINESKLLMKTNGFRKGIGANRKGNHLPISPFALFSVSSRTKAAPCDGVPFSSSLKYGLKQHGNENVRQALDPPTRLLPENDRFVYLGYDGVMRIRGNSDQILIFPYFFPKEII